MAAGPANRLNQGSLGISGIRSGCRGTFCPEQAPWFGDVRRECDVAMRECTILTERLPIRVRQSAVRAWQSSNPRRAIECSAAGMTVPCGEDRRSACGKRSAARGGIACAIRQVTVPAVRFNVARGHVNGSSGGVADVRRSGLRRACGGERSTRSGRVCSDVDQTGRRGQSRDRSIRSLSRVWESTAFVQPVVVGWRPTHSTQQRTSTVARGPSTLRTLRSKFRAVQSTSSTGGVIGTNGGFVVAKIGFERPRRLSGGRTSATDRCDLWRRQGSVTAHQE